jgi:hypothetical protein
MKPPQYIATQLKLPGSALTLKLPGTAVPLKLPGTALPLKQPGTAVPLELPDTVPPLKPPAQHLTVKTAWYSTTNKIDGHTAPPLKHMTLVFQNSASLKMIMISFRQYYVTDQPLFIASLPGFYEFANHQLIEVTLLDDCVCTNL